MEILKIAGCQYIDANSIGEIKLALSAGYKPENILFTETNISNKSLKEALDLGVIINIDSFSQLHRLHKIHPELLEVSLRINPGKGAGKFSEIITAGKEVHGVPIKFGIAEDKVIEICELAKKYNKKITRIHQHIGSNLQGKKEMEVFLETAGSTLKIAKEINNSFWKLKSINFGGGLGIKYKKTDEEFPIEEFVKKISEKIKKSGLNVDVEIEPGRFLTADSGIMVAEVSTIEEKNKNLFVGVDGMFPRPFFYGAYHEIIPCKKTDICKEAVVVGNYCETELDIFTSYKEDDKKTYKRILEIPKEGEYIAVLNAGAYGFEMIPFLYNSKKIPKRILIYNKKITKIKFLEIN